MAHLFDSLPIRGLTLRNRIAVSPMQQYTSVDGLAGDWHLVHLGSRAVGGAGLILVEATAIAPEARWTTADLGIWNDAQVEAFQRINRFLKEQGAAPGIQIGHAGSKGSRTPLPEGYAFIPEQSGGWPLVSSSAVAPLPGYPEPRALEALEIRRVVKQFQEAASRALDAGFQVLELHGAHGYLIHQFLSPLINRRQDDYGGPLENRMRFLLEVLEAVRAVWPDHLPLFLRISASDFAETEASWRLEDSIQLARRVQAYGVDLITASGGGFVQVDKSQVGSGYQLPYAAAIRRETGILTGGVGLITDARQADQAIRTGQADLAVIGRAFLRDPYFPLHAAGALGEKPEVPRPYRRAF